MTCLKQGIKAVKLTSVMRAFPDEPTPLALNQVEIEWGGVEPTPLVLNRVEIE